MSEVGIVTKSKLTAIAEGFRSYYGINNELTLDDMAVLALHSFENYDGTGRVLIQPKDFEGVVGDTAVFQLIAAGEEISYQWQYLNDAGTKWVNSGQEGNKTAALSVPVTAARNGQTYRCVITDGNGVSATSDPAQIIVCD